MKTKLCDVNAAAEQKLPKLTDDKSGLGVHYIDAYVKPMNVQLPDGTAVKCKRRGLKLTLQVGDRKGEGLMRRLERGPDPALMLPPALCDAARQAGVELSFEHDAIHLSILTEPPAAAAAAAR